MHMALLDCPLLGRHREQLLGQLEAERLSVVRLRLLMVHCLPVLGSAVSCRDVMRPDLLLSVLERRDSC